MLFEEIRNIKSEKKDLRNFGLTVGIVLAFISSLLWWKGKDTYTVFGVVSAALVLLGLIVPTLLKPLQKVWMTLAVILGWFMTRLILSIAFYLVFTFIGGLSRLFGKEFLDVKMDKSKHSYWIKRKEKFDKSAYEKQF
jgi:ABC-type uncharacterized transport system permease subunit